MWLELLYGYRFPSDTAWCCAVLCIFCTSTEGSTGPTISPLTVPQTLYTQEMFQLSKQCL
ncbi:hypothetical protein FQN60_005295 [Etheostoma spectabile]|uniref:Uncharacterized protein n=1 Tax=Etheostoma spectabile TaxID=54343 RepID=A0A5J5CDW3_9PERO|nr:hypothetical protein FQN60_005295 [Etheostoma spectabile]